MAENESKSGGNVASTKQAEKPAKQSSEQDNFELLQRLEAAEKKAAQLEADIVALETQKSALRVRADASEPYLGPDGGYKFVVGPRHREKHADCPVMEIAAVDETEAKRVYCLSVRYPKGGDKMIDPVLVPIVAVCKDRRRQRAIELKQQLAALRIKIAAGAVMSEEEKAILADHEAEVFGYAVASAE